jgi:hypothetical protein
MIHFNDSTAANERVESKDLTLQEEYEVVDLINALSLNLHPNIAKQRIELLQRFIYEFEKLRYLRDISRLPCKN